MSCIAGVLRRDGAPADPALVRRMLERMRPRAPDDEQIVHEGPLAFGQAWLRVDGAPQSAMHPLTATPELWIAADARVDRRSELLHALRSAGQDVDPQAPHAALIAAGWRAWGPQLLQPKRLIGDFAFALWDARQRTLVCARDPFGVRPLYYASTPSLFAFASQPDALRALPGIAGALDETSVADFLIFGALLDEGRTLWRDIHTLPPAHLLETFAPAQPPATTAACTPRRYWTLPQPPTLRLAGPQAYAEAFTEVFTQAVADRLPEGPTATHLSGGMDCTSIAALAGPQLRARGHSLHAHHMSCHALLPQDEERAYTERVAAHLQLPLACHELGRHPLYAGWDDPAFATAMPLAYPHLASHREFTEGMLRSGARVLLTGLYGDAVLTPSATRTARLLRSGRWWSLARDAVQHARHTGSLAGLGLRSAVLGRTRPPPWMPAPPDWIEPDFARRADFAGRWQLAWTRYDRNDDACSQLSQPWLAEALRAPEILRQPLVARHPFLDLRVVELLLALPNFMLADKRVLREAMQNRLPEEICTRPKVSLAVDPVHELVKNGKLVHHPPKTGESCGYVFWPRHTAALRRFQQQTDNDSTWNNVLLLAPIALKNWLTQQQ